MAIHKYLKSTEFLKGVRQEMSTTITEYLQCKESGEKVTVGHR